MPLTFAQLKQAIIDNTKPTEICEALQETILATNENELIDSGLPIAAWVYRSEIVTDVLLAEFNQANLNAKGVYSSGVVTINDPAIDIVVMGATDITVNLTGTIRRKITVLGGALLAVNLSGNAYAEIKAYDDAYMVVESEDESLAQVEYNNSSTGAMVANDTSIIHSIVRGNSNTSLTGNNDSFSLIKGFGNSVCLITQNDTSVIDTRPNNNSNLNPPPP